MAQDIVPELWAKIESTFDSAVSMDPFIRSFNYKVDKGTVTDADVFKVVERYGVHASKALRMHLTEENLPNGVLYWNIANRTIRPMFEKVYELINESAEKELLARNKRDGINIKAVKPQFPEERINEFINKVVAVSFDGGTNESR